MDLPTLASVLQLALSTVPEERKAGEQRLYQYQHVPGHLVGLLQIIMTSNVDISVRQVASIHFKNLIARHWTRSEQGEQISETDKGAVRENLLEALIHVPSIIRVQLGDGLKTVIHHDYPGRWPSLLPSIDAFLRTQDQQQVYGALYALRILTRKYDLQGYEQLFSSLSPKVEKHVIAIECYQTIGTFGVS